MEYARSFTELEPVRKIVFMYKDGEHFSTFERVYKMEYSSSANVMFIFSKSNNDKYEESSVDMNEVRNIRKYY